MIVFGWLNKGISLLILLQQNGQQNELLDLLSIDNMMIHW
jgi:hypothetical protein